MSRFVVTSLEIRVFASYFWTGQFWEAPVSACFGRSVRLQFNIGKPSSSPAEEGKKFLKLQAKALNKCNFGFLTVSVLAAWKLSQKNRSSVYSRSASVVSFLTMRYRSVLFSSNTFSSNYSFVASESFYAEKLIFPLIFGVISFHFQTQFWLDAQKVAGKLRVIVALFLNLTYNENWTKSGSRWNHNCNIEIRFELLSKGASEHFVSWLMNQSLDGGRNSYFPSLHKRLIAIRTGTNSDQIDFATDLP